MPSGNVDFTPTFLTLLGLSIPSSVQGRPLDEALVGATGGPKPNVREVQHTARTPDGRYAVTARLSIVRAGTREYRYFDGTTVTRR